MKVDILKYNGGNIQSVIFALNRLGIEPILTDDEEEIRNSDKVIFPGVGEASSCMNSFKASGLDKILPTLKQPVLGICVGLQLMCNYSEEGNTKGLGIFDVNVKKFQSSSSENLKVPQMGWNTLFDLQSPLFEGISEQSYMYYVHSYFAELGKETIAKTDYTLPYSAALRKANFYAVQFHTEKSSKLGSQILENFLNVC
ncbi:MAG: imidazole glycerol phosphate synthase subunit HisH [Cytophagales bacterium]